MNCDDATKKNNSKVGKILIKCGHEFQDTGMYGFVLNSTEIPTKLVSQSRIFILGTLQDMIIQDDTIPFRSRTFWQSMVREYILAESRDITCWSAPFNSSCVFSFKSLHSYFAVALLETHQYSSDNDLIQRIERTCALNHGIMLFCIQICEPDSLPRITGKSKLVSLFKRKNPNEIAQKKLFRTHFHDEIDTYAAKSKFLLGDLKAIASQCYEPERSDLLGSEQTILIPRRGVQGVLGNGRRDDGIASKPDTLENLLRSASIDFPDMMAFKWLDGSGECTFRELDKSSMKIADSLVNKHNIPKGKSVLMLMDYTFEAICCYYGCIFAGIVPVILINDITAEQLSSISKVMHENSCHKMILSLDQIKQWDIIRGNSVNLSIVNLNALIKSSERLHVNYKMNVSSHEGTLTVLVDIKTSRQISLTNKTLMERCKLLADPIMDAVSKETKVTKILLVSCNEFDFNVTLGIFLGFSTYISDSSKVKWEQKVTQFKGWFLVKLSSMGCY